MTPLEYLSQYHKLTVSDPRMGLSFQANIKMYMSGWNDVARNEYENVLSKIAKKLGYSYVNKIPDTFYFKDDPAVDPNEPFYKGSLRRAFAGRGAPDEIRDAVRLAWLVKKCSPYDPKKYCEGWFGQDCNAFVGNYQGVSPSTAIFAYAKGYGVDDADDKIPGASADVYITAGLFPLPVIESVDQIKSGDVLITHGAPNKNGKRYRHIAVIDTFKPLTGNKAEMTIVEWGTDGDASAHMDVGKRVDMLTGTKVDGWSKKLVGFKEGSFTRFFLDSAKLSSLSSRGWDVAGVFGK